MAANNDYSDILLLFQENVSYKDNTVIESYEKFYTVDSMNTEYGILYEIQPNFDERDFYALYNYFANNIYGILNEIYLEPFIEIIEKKMSYMSWNGNYTVLNGFFYLDSFNTRHFCLHEKQHISRDEYFFALEYLLDSGKIFIESSTHSLELEKLNITYSKLNQAIYKLKFDYGVWNTLNNQSHQSHETKFATYAQNFLSSLREEYFHQIDLHIHAQSLNKIYPITGNILTPNILFKL